MILKSHNLKILCLIELIPVCLFIVSTNNCVAAKLNQRCPSSCRVTEESENCGQIRNTKQYSNTSEICGKHLRNKFKSDNDCDSKCSVCKLDVMISQCTPRKLAAKYGICMKKPKTGLCRAYFIMWYYNSAEKKCETFVYGGCGGNANKFETHLQCLLRCGLSGFIN